MLSSRLFQGLSGQVKSELASSRQSVASGRISMAAALASGDTGRSYIFVEDPYAQTDA